MPTDKDLIKDTLAVGGHYSNYSPGFIVEAPILNRSGTVSLHRVLV